MTDYTPTTERVRSEYARDTNATKKHEVPRAEFDRWLEQVKAEAWDAALDYAYRVASATAARTRSIDAILDNAPRRKEETND